MQEKRKKKLHICQECGEKFCHGIGLKKHQRQTGHQNHPDFESVVTLETPKAPKTVSGDLEGLVEKFQNLGKQVKSQSNTNQLNDELEQIVEEFRGRLETTEPESLELSTEFLKRFGEIADSFAGPGKVPSRLANEATYGMGWAFGRNLGEWMWDLARPGSKSQSEDPHIDKLQIVVPPRLVEEFVESKVDLRREFQRSTGVELPFIKLKSEPGYVRVFWGGNEIFFLHETSPKERQREMLERLKSEAWRFLSVKQVEDKLTRLWLKHPEMRRAYKEQHVGLMPVVQLLRAILKENNTIEPFGLFIDSILEQKAINRAHDRIVEEALSLVGVTSSRTRPTASPNDRCMVNELKVELGKALLPLVNPAEGGVLLERITSLRRNFEENFGWIIPGVTFQRNYDIKPNEYKISVRERECSAGAIQMGLYLAVGPPAKLEKVRGIRATEPVYSMPSLWIEAQQRGEVEKLGCMIFSPASVLTMDLTDTIWKQAQNLFTYRCLDDLLHQLKDRQPTLHKFFTQDRFLLKRTLAVFRGLLEEGVSVKDQLTILETVLEQSSEPRSNSWLVEFTRERLAEFICRPHSSDGTLNTMCLSPALEKLCRDSLTESGLELPINDEKLLWEALCVSTEELTENGFDPILITVKELRRPLFDLFGKRIQNLRFIAHSEVPNSIEIATKSQLEMSVRRHSIVTSKIKHAWWKSQLARSTRNRKPGYSRRSR